MYTYAVPGLKLWVVCSHFPTPMACSNCWPPCPSLDFRQGKALSLSMCMCISVCVMGAVWYMLTSMCQYACPCAFLRRSEEDVWCPTLLVSTLFFWDSFSYWTLSKAGSWEVPAILLFPCSTVLWLQACQWLCLAFYRCWHLKSVLHVFIEVLFYTEP